MLALSVAILSLGYVNPMSTVQASETEVSQDNVGFHVVDYTEEMYRQTLEDTLFFTSIENPNSFTVISKDTALEILGVLYQDNTETTFLYVKNRGVKGYVDKQFIDMETALNNEFSTLPNGIRPYTPVENADGTITVYDDWGDKLILRPTGDEYYVDQYGAKRSKEGYDIDPFTGLPMKPRYDIDTTPIVPYISYNSGLKAY